MAAGKSLGLALCLIISASVSANEVYEERIRACYWGLFDLFDAAYRRDADGQCLQIDYLRAFSREELSKATWKGYAKANGEARLAQDRPRLRPLVEAYSDVAEGDRFSFCQTREAIELRFNQRLVYRDETVDLAEAYLGIWLSLDESGRVGWGFSDCS